MSPPKLTKCSKKVGPVLNKIDRTRPGVPGTPGIGRAVSKYKETNRSEGELPIKPSKQTITVLVPPTARVRCLFCFQTDQNDALYGPFYQNESKQIAAHLFCLVFSDLISSCYKNPQKGFLGFKIGDVREQIKQGKENICDYCQKNGSTVTCSFPGCSQIYHFPCGITNQCKLKFMCQYLSICNHHDDDEIEKRVCEVNPFWGWKTSVPDFTIFFAALAVAVKRGVRIKKKPRLKASNEERRKQQFLEYFELQRNPFCFEFVNVEHDSTEVMHFEIETETVEIFPGSINTATAKIKCEIMNEIEDCEENLATTPSGESSEAETPLATSPSGESLSETETPLIIAVGTPPPEEPIIPTPLQIQVPDHQTQITNAKFVNVLGTKYAVKNGRIQRNSLVPRLLSRPVIFSNEFNILPSLTRAET